MKLRQKKPIDYFVEVEEIELTESDYEESEDENSEDEYDSQSEYEEIELTESDYDESEDEYDAQSENEEIELTESAYDDSQSENEENEHSCKDIFGFDFQELLKEMEDDIGLQSFVQHESLEITPEDYDELKNEVFAQDPPLSNPTVHEVSGYDGPEEAGLYFKLGNEWISRKLDHPFGFSCTKSGQTHRFIKVASDVFSNTENDDEQYIYDMIGKSIQFLVDCSIYSKSLNQFFF